jgi:hypothetical protein
MTLHHGLIALLTAVSIASGGCTSGPGGDGATDFARCARDRDCPDGEACGADGRCAPAEAEREDTGDADAAMDVSIPALCDAGQEGCVCDWGQPELMGVTIHTSYSIGYAGPAQAFHDVRHDARGYAVVAWHERSLTGGPPDKPVLARTLDPSTETWSETMRVFRTAHHFHVGLDDAGRATLLGGDGGLVGGIQWTRFDPSVASWSGEKTLDPVMVYTQTNFALRSPGSFTYAVEHPVVKKLVGDAWEHWSAPAPSSGASEVFVAHGRSLRHQPPQV